MDNKQDKSNKKSINTTLNKDLYSDLQILASNLTKSKGEKVYTNDLIEEGIKLVLDKYKDKY